MCSEKTQKYYSCGHPRPQSPIRALIAHAKPILCPHSQQEVRQQQAHLPHEKSYLSPPSSSHAIIFNNPFNDSTTPPPPRYLFSANSSRRNSLTKVASSASSSSTISLERELTAEERVTAGMEFMHAFLASRSKSSSATSSRASSITLEQEIQMGRRAAISAA